MLPTRPFSQRPGGEGGKCVIGQPNKGVRGTPWRATEPDETPEFGYSALGAAVFWWVFSKSSHILCFQHPFSHHPRGAWVGGVGRNYRTNKGSRGTPRGVAAPKCGYSALESAIFLWIPPKRSNNIRLQLSPPPMWGMGNANLPTKQRARGTPQKVTERYGT